MNDVTIVLRKTLCTTSSVSERGKPQCGDPEHRITLCEIYSIKTENIDGYIIKRFIKSLETNISNQDIQHIVVDEAHCCKLGPWFPPQIC